MSDTSRTDPAADLKVLGQKWWLLVLFGVITFGFGVVLTFKPGKSVHAIAVILGIWLLILGVFRLIQAIGGTGDRTGHLVVGLLSIVIAIILLHHTTTTIAVLGFVIGIFWTIGGVALLFDALTANEGRMSWPVALLGLIATVVGVLCLVYPSLSLSILCVINGVGMIVYGIVEVLAGFQARKLNEV